MPHFLPTMLSVKFILFCRDYENKCNLKHIRFQFTLPQFDIQSLGKYTMPLVKGLYDLDVEMEASGSSRATSPHFLPHLSLILCRKPRVKTLTSRLSWLRRFTEGIHIYC